MSIFGNIMSAIFGHGGQTPLRGSHRGAQLPPLQRRLGRPANRNQPQAHRTSM
jgi:hypothetical protein